MSLSAGIAVFLARLAISVRHVAIWREANASEARWRAEADSFFKGLRKRVRNVLPDDAYDESSWSCRSWSNFYFQKISMANLKGLGQHFMVAAAKLRSAGGVPFT